ncbi:uncharacterized protein G2W53_042569 [Senna tora]|uniref:Uncharacterized protein n=1 Tax=Senna tora TaxID=362788 RepID=A0A834SJB0_9FABA|nr:uncharacterized protein G2W53_042569 [Senna tora]
MSVSSPPPNHSREGSSSPQDPYPSPPLPHVMLLILDLECDMVKWVMV